MSDRLILAVVADLGGEGAAAGRRLRRVDLDGIGTLPHRLGVHVDVPDGDRTTRLDVASADDFHPDVLVQRLPGLAALLASRGAGSGPPAPPATRTTPRDLPPPTGGAALLESILRTSAGAPPVDPALDDFVRRVTDPFVVRPPAPDPRGDTLDDAVRRILEAPRFHALESTWRGLANLVATADSGSAAEIWVLDAAASEAPAMLADELASPGAPPVAAAVAAYGFGPDDASLAALAGLAAVAQAASIPIVADLDPRVLGLPDARALGLPDATARIGMIDHWRRFRRHPLAAHVLVCLPRVLGRLPYGANGERVSAMSFEERVAAADHERFLWTSAALAFGGVLVRAFAADGSTSRIERHAELHGLPVHVTHDPSGEARPVPCAEVVMSASTIRSVVDQGCTVLASVRDEDRAAFWGIGMLDGSPLPPLG